MSGDEKPEYLAGERELPMPKRLLNRYTLQRCADGSLRPEPRRTRQQREQQRAFADFEGVIDADEILPSSGNLSAILSQIAKKMQCVDEAVEPDLLAPAWRAAVGDFIAGQAELRSISRGTALISTAHPAVRFELQRLKPRIITALNARFGAGVVKQLRVTHG